MIKYGPFDGFQTAFFLFFTICQETVQKSVSI